MWRETCGQAEKGREWWCEDVGVVVAEKIIGFEEWLQRSYRVTYYRYRAQKAVVKQAT